MNKEDAGVEKIKLQQRIQEVDVFLRCLNGTRINNNTRHSNVVQSDDQLWTSSTAPPTLDQIVQKYAPIGLEDRFKDLYRILHSSLVKLETNHSAFLQGPRGSGKSLVLQQCLTAIQDELQAIGKPPFFRHIHLNGILIPGKHISAVLHEILLQLSAIAMDGDRWQELLRLRKTSFTNHLQLLNETIELASVDNSPILFIFDEVEAFLNNDDNARQVLLYHLLDRVTAKDSLVSFVGLTCYQGVVELLEKRVRSRAEGTARFIDFGSAESYSGVVRILLGGGEELAGSLSDEIRNVLLPTEVGSPCVGGDKKDVCSLALQRDHALGKDLRWFSNLLYYALSLYRLDVTTKLDQMGSGESSEAMADVCFESRHLLEAMRDMGASFVSDSGAPAPTTVQNRVVDPRIKVLCDLSNPELALVLAAGRIISRDARKEITGGLPPLTLHRILEEYRTTYKGSSGRYNRHVLLKSFRELLDVGVFRPASEHTGLDPLQYMHDDSLYYHVDINTLVLLPLHFVLDVQDHLKKALDANLLQCSTALREWGRKIF